jgi:hypothetical protein
MLANVPSGVLFFFSEFVLYCEQGALTIPGNGQLSGPTHGDQGKITTTSGSLLKKRKTKRSDTFCFSFVCSGMETQEWRQSLNTTLDFQSIQDLEDGMTWVFALFSCFLCHSV